MGKKKKATSNSNNTSSSVADVSSQDSKSSNDNLNLEETADSTMTKNEANLKKDELSDDVKAKDNGSGSEAAEKVSDHKGKRGSGSPTSKRAQARRDTAISVFIASLCLLTVVLVSYQTQKDYILVIPLCLVCPVVLYELFLWMKGMYKSRFGVYEEGVKRAVRFVSEQQMLIHHTLVSQEDESSFEKLSETPEQDLKKQKRIALMFVRILYSLTYITFGCVILFFTYETLESSYYGSKDMYDVKQNIVSELQGNLLQQFCCPRKTISDQRIRQYLQTQITSALQHYHIRDLFDDPSSAIAPNRQCSHKDEKNIDPNRKNQLQGTLDQLTESVLDVLEHNTGFKYDPDAGTWEWLFDFKPIDVLKVSYLLISHSVYVCGPLIDTKLRSYQFIVSSTEIRSGNA